MLRVNERFYVERDKRNWILCEVSKSKATKGKNKGKVVERVSESYYGNLGALCRHCMDKSLDPDGGFSGMLEALEQVHMDLKRMLRKHDLDVKRTLQEAAK